MARRRTAGGASYLTVRLLVLLAALVALALVGRSAVEVIPRFTDWVSRGGAAGACLFVLGYVVAAVALVPGSLLTISAGAIFGIIKGTGLVFVAATLGAAAAFLVSRYLARTSVERRLAANDRFEAIDRAVGREGFKIVLLLRLSPIFPYNLLNYALGLTRVRFPDYLLASVGMLPATLLYVYYGKVLGDIARIAAGTPVPRSVWYYSVLALGLVATIAVTTVVTRIARRALRETTGRPVGAG